AMALSTERTCGGPALVLSTGVIGVPLPTDQVLKGIEEAAGGLCQQDDGKVARAILTTDTCTKTYAVEVDDGDHTFTVGGMAKGSGMIHPNMATMLAMIATDAPLGTPALRAMLKRAVDRSFHEISVDGDTSTNDAVLLLSRRDGDPLSEQGLACLEQAVTAVARRLAEKIIEDGEGKSRIMEIVVKGAASEKEARAIASAVACSSLVKTALAGGDPNWGRIVAAAGTAGIPIDFDTVSASLADRLVFRKGQPVDFDEAELAELFGRERVRVELDLARGPHQGRMLTTDLTRRYVEINSEYTT
ncbi:MAG: bifunctional ornithine acetyltransferase/N-acetylglutamate synthase, partial [Polyangiaceae bacterium]